MADAQLGLFGAEPAPKAKRRDRRAEDAEAVAWCEQERKRVLQESKRARRKREPTEDSESARVVRAELAAVEPEPCFTGHAAAFICPACAECGDTDGCGFLHRQVCGGRIPLRACKGCGKLKTHGTWNHADWFHCLECVPLGQKKVDAGA